ncbi:MAG: Spo0B domain-containing protein [Planctomycetota bacterium]|jgi:sensor histidine kinase regulating citrate/malate metabolism|nr:Spo0B domain-containing protein [Planctomycetota bacterium]
MRLQARITLMIVAIVLLSASVTIALSTAMFINRIDKTLERNLLNVADTVARLPVVLEGLRGPPVAGEIQRQVRTILESLADVDFITVCNMKSERYAHPNPGVIGLTFMGGDEARVVGSGAKYVSVAEGTLGVSVRAFVPVFDGREQIGFVAAGTMVYRVEDLRRQMINYSAVYLVSGLVIGVAGAVLLARKLKGILLGLEPEELAQLHHDHLGMLEAVHEGVIAINADGVVTLSNKSARRLLGMEKVDLKGMRLDGILPDSRLPDVMAAGEAEYDREQRIRGTMVIANRVPIIEKGKVVGAVETFRDRTLLVRLAEELTGAKQLVEALRASSHEFLNKLQVLLGLLDMEEYGRAKSYIIDVHRYQLVQNKQLLHTFKDPVIAGLMLGKSGYCCEQNVRLTVTPESQIGHIEDGTVSHVLVTVLGNLIDNAVESARNIPGGGGRVVVDVRHAQGEVAIKVGDNGGGILPGHLETVFKRGFSTKGEGRGIGLYLVRQELRSLGGDIAVVSRPGETVFTARLKTF